MGDIRKAWTNAVVVAIMALVAQISGLTGLEIAVSEASLTSVVGGIISGVLVWFIPNSKGAL